MKKIFTLGRLFYLLSAATFVPVSAKAALVNCQGPKDCTFDQFLGMLQGIYTFIINIATPLAILAITAGAILMMISAGNPNTMSLGKKVFWSAVIGLILVFASKAIINLVLSSMGATTI